MNYIDIAIVVIILITALISFMQGLTWMITFISTFVVAGLLAVMYTDQLAAALPVDLGNVLAQKGLAAVLIVIGVLIAGAIINAILRKIIKSTGFTTFDRLLGALLGVGLGALTVTLLLMLFGITEAPKQDVWKQSKFIPKFEELGAQVKSYIPENFNTFIDEKLGLNASQKNSNTLDNNTPVKTEPTGLTPSSSSN